MKNKKPLMALAGVALLGAVGGTFAYFTSSTTFENIFKSSPYSTKATETFKSPEDWTPGTTTDKTLTVENTGEVEVAVRVKLTETWTSQNGGSLALSQDGNVAAVINFADGYDADWTKNGDYYYYNSNLAKGDVTTALIESVTFNEEITADVTCTEETDDTNGTVTKTCTSTGDGYDGATYTLKIDVETVQADAKDEVWK